MRKRRLWLEGLALILLVGCERREVEPTPVAPAYEVASTPNDPNTLISPEGRLHVGTGLYLINGSRYGRVIALTKINPRTGQSERGVVISDGKREEYRPTRAVVTYFRVRADGQ